MKNNTIVNGNEKVRLNKRKVQCIGSWMCIVVKPAQSFAVDHWVEHNTMEMILRLESLLKMTGTFSRFPWVPSAKIFSMSVDMISIHPHLCCVQLCCRHFCSHWYCSSPILTLPYLSVCLPSTGGGEFIVGLTEDLAKMESVAGQFIGTISHVNIFNKVLDSSMIKWMSHGCNEIAMDVLIPWSHFKQGFVADVKITKEASCADNEGR